MSSGLSNYNNDFNYPTLSRKDLMYLDKIRDRDFPIKKINQINSNRDWSVNLYNLDIEKSMPNRSTVLTNKIDFINKIDDIELAQPKKERILDKPNYILDVHDIEKAYPNMFNIRTQRRVNPLNPIYKLPSYPIPLPVTPPKFIRDQIDISDIEKARPNKLFPMKMRPPKTYDDIKGIHPKKQYVRKVFYDNFNYKDINNKKEKKFRNTNPLDPEYDKPYGGYIEGTKPCLPIYYFNTDNRTNSLSNEDIYGTMPGSKNYYYNYRYYDKKERFDPNDIPGACAGSRKDGITTQRCTNPLAPDYQFIGQSEVLDCFGQIIDHNSQKKRRPNNKIIYRNKSNPTVREFENYEKCHNDNYINNNFNYNNNNNLCYSQDFHNVERKDRRNRKIPKSLSQVNVDRKVYTINDDYNNEKNINNIDYKLPLINDKSDYNPDYNEKQKQNQNLLKKHTTLILRNVNRNRLDAKIKHYDKLNKFRMSSHYNKNGTIDVAKSGNDTIFKKYNL